MMLGEPSRSAAALRAAGVDSLVVARPENVRYFTDMSMDLAVSLGQPVAVVVDAEPLAIQALVAPRVMAGSIPDDVGERTEIYLYGRFYAWLDASPGAVAASRRRSVRPSRGRPAGGGSRATTTMPEPRSRPRT